MNDDKAWLANLEDTLGSKILGVPKDTKFVITISEDKETEQFNLDMLNLSGDLDIEETYNALLDIFDNLTDIVDVLEYHIEEKYRVLDKAEKKSKFKIVKGE